MNKKILFLFFALTLAAVYLACAVYVAMIEKSVPTGANDLSVIIIDAGHGGADPGKPGTILNEAEINLEIAKILEKMLTDKGFIVIMTRVTAAGVISLEGMQWDKHNDMNERKAIIDKSNAELFLSIHCNSYTDSTCRGAQVFFPPGDTASEKAAKTMQSCLSEVAEVKNSRVAMEDADTRLINNNTMPSLLAECGFLSNPREEWLLSTPEYRNLIAEALFKGICIHFGIQETNDAATSAYSAK